MDRCTRKSWYSGTIDPETGTRSSWLRRITGRCRTTATAGTTAAAAGMSYHSTNIKYMFDMIELGSAPAWVIEAQDWMPSLRREYTAS
jgi:hypothetical protein